MKRRDFIGTSCKACGAVSLGLLLGSSFLESCGVAKLTVTKATQQNGKVTIPLKNFDGNDAQLVRVSDYPFDVAVKKGTDNNYQALVLMCTHAGHPLVKAGATYYCTLHGSRFAPNGNVQTGPASKPMMSLPITIENDQLTITMLKPVY